MDGLFYQDVVVDQTSILSRPVVMHARSGEPAAWSGGTVVLADGSLELTAAEGSLEYGLGIDPEITALRTESSLTALHGDGSAHGVMDPGQEKGLAPEEVAQAILRGVREERNEVLVGGVELAAVHAKRFVPGLFERLLRGRGT